MHLTALSSLLVRATLGLPQRLDLLLPGALRPRPRARLRWGTLVTASCTAEHLGNREPGRQTTPAAQIMYLPMESPSLFYQAQKPAASKRLDYC